MGAGDTDRPGWQQVQVLVRSDILKSADKNRLDISDTCNRALAIKLGIAYDPAVPEKKKAARVIIAQTAAPVHPPRQAVPPAPVINAEDPSVPGKVIKEHKEKKAAPAVKPPVVPVPEPAAVKKAPQPVSAPAPAPAPAGKKAAKGSKKEDTIKKFVSTKIARETEEGPDAIIGKDELYERFGRWCRDHDYPLPEKRAFAVALKNKYAFGERTIGGVPSWYGIRVK
ncbi:hypothetical protein [Methanoregula sp. UBA64]|jgi:hypothetical protein|uniref:hypothetical protein n=1 Tax=Methanoregula sp. UBA64 TaxID=1915554 RepID=UPI0025D684BF|nr:hypothetical protein [Methanoregula sp. UBA64]